MHLKNKLLFFAFLIFILSGCTAKPDTDKEILMISAASSLSGVMEELAASFEKDNPNARIVANFGSSSKLRNQIENGAPADVFLSASTEDVTMLADKGLVNKASIAPFAGNHLLLATSTEIDDQQDVEEVLSVLKGPFAIAEPDSVPLGAYTKRALETMGMWDSLTGNMIFAKDARQVVTYLDSGNAQAGIIYASDANLSEKVGQMTLLSIESEDIIYPAAIISRTEQQQIAEEFMTYILSEEGQRIIEKFGFLPAEGAES